MALDQINLKLPPAVADRWRAAAAAEGLSVRDWLLAQLEGPGGRGAPAGGDPLADRVAQLERTTAELAAAVAQLRGPAAAPRSPRPDPVAVAQLEGVAPLPERRLTPDEAAGLLPLRELAEALGVVPSALTNWAAREAGKRAGNPAGAVYRGHRLRGKGLLPGAQKPGWLFDRVAD